jgi:hypothetical protein
MSRAQYKHFAAAIFILTEIDRAQYEQLSRAEKKRYRSFAKKNELPKIWNTDEEYKTEYPHN